MTDAQVVSQASQLDIWQATSFVFSTVALILSVVAVFVSKKTLRVSSYFAIKELVNQLNGHTLEDDEILSLADAMQYPEYRDQPLAEKKRRWVAFHWLNVHEAMFFSRDHAELKGHYGEFGWRTRLVTVLSDPDIYEWMARGGYDPRFVKFCHQLMKDTGKKKEDAKPLE